MLCGLVEKWDLGFLSVARGVVGSNNAKRYDIGKFVLWQDTNNVFP